MLVDTYAIWKCSWQDRSENLFIFHSHSQQDLKIKPADVYVHVWSNLSSMYLLWCNLLTNWLTINYFVKYTVIKKLSLITKLKWKPSLELETTVISLWSFFKDLAKICYTYKLSDMFLLNMPMHTLPYNEHSSTEVQFYIHHCQRLISTHVHARTQTYYKTSMI